MTTQNENNNRSNDFSSKIKLTELDLNKIKEFM